MQYGCVNGLFQPKTFVITLLAWMLCLPAHAVMQAQTAKLLDNRFRIDHSVEAISLLVARSTNSASVVVVQPDGSKWYVHRHPLSVRWSATNSSDFIRIENPTPGPWQLIGEVLEGSELRLISEVILRNEPLPAQVYRSERVKLVAELFSDDERIVMRDFNKQLNWRVSINSANRSGDANMGAGPFAIGTYQDLGTGLDERPHDGLFTSEMDFDFPSGLYFYKVEVDNAVLHRELTGQVEILPQPIRLSLRKTDDEQEQILVVSVDPEILHAPIHLDLSIETPERERIPRSFSLDKARQEFDLPEMQGFGHYRIRGEAVGSHQDGREFLLHLPELSFYLIPPPPAPLSEVELAIVEYEQAQIREEEAQKRVLWVLAGINFVLLLCCVIGLLIWRKRSAKEEVVEEVVETKTELTPDELDLNLGQDSSS